MSDGTTQNPRNYRISRDSRFFGWWWIWLFFLIAFIWFSGWGWGGYGGWWWGRPRAVIVASGPGIVVLDSTDKPAFVGQPFSVSGVTVENKVNDHAYWVSAPNSASMLVVTSANHNGNNGIIDGTHLNVTGTVEQAPPAAQAKQQWGISSNDALRLEQDGVYVQASGVRKVQLGTSRRS